MPTDGGLRAREKGGAYRQTPERVERAAAATWAALNDGREPDAWHHLPEVERQAYRRAALAALVAAGELVEVIPCE